jgi:glutaredoxin
MKRLLGFFGFALVPVLVLALLYPDRFVSGPDIGAEIKYPQHPGADIVVFVRDGCPHCADFREFALDQEWEVDYHEITNIDSQKMFKELQAHVPNLNQGVPTIVINGRVVQGYEMHETTGQKLRSMYDLCRSSGEGCRDYEEFIASNDTVELEAALGTCTEDCEADLDKYVFDLWIFGTVDLTLLSLPALAVLLGFLDGFNPCAMWVLITLLTLLINTHDMRKVWIIGGTFLFVSGAVYYLFIAAWLNVFLLIGYNMIVQKAIGLMAILGGGFYLYEAFGKDPNQCKVTDYKRRQKTIARMQEIMKISAWPAMILGVAVLAASVNMIELVCTAGLPAIFTQILALNEVSNAARYGYIGLYILLYMIDDLIIFAIAIYTLHATGLTTKYRRFTLIFGGALMYGLGILLIFFPEALTFHG